MRADLGLVCPRCRPGRAAPETGTDVPAPQALRAARDGHALLCDRCSARFPVIDGVPVVINDLETFFAHQAAPALAPIADGAELDMMLAHLPAHDPLRQARETVAAAAATALRDHLMPPLPERPEYTAPCDGAPLDAWLGAWLDAWLDGWISPEQQQLIAAVDLGCGVGPAAIAMTRRGLFVVALDLLMQPLRLLRQLRDDGNAPVPIREVGSRYRIHRCDLGAPITPGRLQIAAADALDPPLVAERWDVVHVGNLVDNVRDPVLLLGQADALLRPGGRLFLTVASSYGAHVTPEPAWLGASGRNGRDEPSPEDTLRALLRGEDPRLPHLRYDLLDDRPGLTWPVQRDERFTATYSVHAIVAEKLPPRP